MTYLGSYPNFSRFHMTIQMLSYAHVRNQDGFNIKVSVKPL